MDQDQLIQQLMTTFLEELEEHVQSLERELLVLEKANGSPSGERLKTVFRTVHSLKGAARSVGVEPIETACHQLEEILAVCRSQGRIQPDQIGLLLSAADAFADAGRRLREGRELAGGALGGLLPSLERAAQEAVVLPGLPLCEISLPSTGGGQASATGEVVGTELCITSPAANGVQAPSALPQGTSTSPGQPLPVGKSGPERVAPPRLPEGPTGSGTESGPGGQSVRVQAEKLDLLLARSGELLVGRRRVQSHFNSLTTMQELIRIWRNEWRQLDSLLKRRSPPEGRIAVRSRDTAATLPRKVLALLARASDRLTTLDEDLQALMDALAVDSRYLDQVATALEEEIRHARMLPFAWACQGLERMARDLALRLGKEVHFRLEGGTVELDRAILEGLKDPLLHLVRNAVDHGLEPPAAREAAGKPGCGDLLVRASLQGNRVEVFVADDGRGLNLEALRQQARKQGLKDPADEANLVELIFHPGMTTAPIITDVSGRGVGLDIVKTRVEALHGSVTVGFVEGRGVCFKLNVPLTLSTLRVLQVEVNGQQFMLPAACVQQLQQVDPRQLCRVEGRSVLAFQGELVPVVSLRGLLRLPPGAAGPLPARRSLVVLAAGERRVALEVDAFGAEQEIIIKGLGPRVQELQHVAAATILPSGQVALVLHVGQLIRTALASCSASAAEKVAAPVAKPRRRIVIAEDSVTTRTLQKSILETAGYEVMAAPNGAVAWNLLQARSVDLLVSDVDMPELDGFALTRQVRQSESLARLPVILVTSRGTDEDRARGIEVGADAYLVKSGFNQAHLLETIQRLLE